MGSIALCLQAMAKIIRTEWGRYAIETGTKLPRLTASLLRRTAVSTMRESGQSRRDQRVLASHMAHRPVTADRDYDRTRQVSAKTTILRKMRSSYVVIANLKYICVRTLLDHLPYFSLYTTHTSFMFQEAGSSTAAAATVSVQQKRCDAPVSFLAFHNHIGVC